MKQCPVCNSPMNTHLCPGCGYDSSRDYGKYPTFGPVRNARPVSALRSLRTPADSLVCEKCGGTAFTIRVPDNTRRCAKCGWSPDETPRLECACGSVYFTARLSDGALLCPMCGRTLALEEFLRRVLPSKSEANAPIRAPEIPIPPQVKPHITAIAAGSAHTVALYSDGTVRAIGDNRDGQCQVEQWSGIIAIAAGDKHTVGLKQDGTVVAVGATIARRISENHCCAVDTWKDITAIAAGASYTIGLRKDGTLAVAGLNRHAEYTSRNVTGIRKIAAGTRHIALLLQNGTPLWENFSRLQQQKWRDILELSVGSDHILGLTRNGTILAAGSNTYGQCFANWTNITAIAAGYDHSLALRKNGTVAAAGDNRAGQCNTQNWTNITAIAAGSSHSVGLKKDGTLVAAGTNLQGCCDVEKLHL